MTITYDEALSEQIRAHLADHDRRTVTDPTKRHAAVAVVLVDSEVGEDRVDSALADDGIVSAWSSPGAPHRGGGLPASEPGLGAGAHDLCR